MRRKYPAYLLFSVFLHRRLPVNFALTLVLANSMIAANIADSIITVFFILFSLHYFYNIWGNEILKCRSLFHCMYQQCRGYIEPKQRVAYAWGSIGGLQIAKVLIFYCSDIGGQRPSSCFFFVSNSSDVITPISINSFSFLISSAGEIADAAGAACEVFASWMRLRISS